MIKKGNIKQQVTVRREVSALLRKKRILILLALAISATASPAVYQYLIEPRVKAAGLQYEIMGMKFDPDLSSSEGSAFSLYLKLTNYEDVDVILSPLDVDVYYYSPLDDRYVNIGTFSSNADFKVPAKGYIGTQLSDTGTLVNIIDAPDSYFKEYDDYNPNKYITGILTISKQYGFIEGANEALVNLINNGTIDIVFKGTANYGPISIPVRPNDIVFNQKILDDEIIIKDVFLYRKAGYGGNYIPLKDTFVIHTLIRNPSGVPFRIEDFELELYDDNGKKRGNAPGRLLDILQSRDPDDGASLTSIFNKDEDGISRLWYDFREGDYYVWRDVFFAFNLTDPLDPKNKTNVEWFLGKLLDENIVDNMVIKGPASIIVGTDKETGFRINMKRQPKDYLTMRNAKYYQKYINKYEQKASFDFIGPEPITLFGNITVSKINISTIEVNTKSKDMTVGMEGRLIIENPYRFEFIVKDLETLYRHSWNRHTEDEPLFAEAQNKITTKIEAAQREVIIDKYGKIHRTTKISPSKSNKFYIDLTTTFNTKDEDNVGLYRVLKDLGADPNLLKLTDPFAASDDEDAQAYPYETMEWLINKEVNPFTLLNEISLTSMVKDYQPLECQHFGDSIRPLNEIEQQAYNCTDMPLCDNVNFPTADHGYFCKIPNIQYWIDYYEGKSSPFVFDEDKLGRYNKYDVISHYERKVPSGESMDPFPHDTDLSNEMLSGLKGVIFKSRGEGEDDKFEYVYRVKDTNGNPADSYHSEWVWRVYHTQEFTPNQDPLYMDIWGYDYDTIEGGTRGYYSGIYLHSNEYALLAQNFTLDPTIIGDLGENIDKVTLSINYKYANSDYGDGVDEREAAFVLFSFFDQNEANGKGGYSYNKIDPWDEKVYPEIPDQVSFGPYIERYGWVLPFTPEKQWGHYSVDLTQYVLDHMDDYNATKDPAFLKGEVCYGGRGLSTKNPLVVYFDDIVLNIKYKDENVSNTIGALTLKDFFYTLMNDFVPVEGDMFKIFADLAEKEIIDSLDFWKYMGGEDINPEIDLTDGMDLFEYFIMTNLSIQDFIKILEVEYKKLGSGEPINFLDMLTRSKYETLSKSDGFYDAYRYGDLDIETMPSDWKYTSNGPRKESDDFWIISDPYVASHEFMEFLSTNIGFAGFDERELWVMLEDFGISVQWILLYLITHGWSSSDVFDLLEALGFSCETKHLFEDLDGVDRTRGTLKISFDMKYYLYHKFLISQSDATIHLYDKEVEFDLGKNIIDDGDLQLLGALCQDSWHTMMQTAGNLPGSSTGTGTIPVKRGWWDILTPETIPWEYNVYPNDFEFNIDVRPLAYSGGYPLKTQFPEHLIDPDEPVPPGFDKSLLNFDENEVIANYGLNGVGCRLLSGLMRTHYNLIDKASGKKRPLFSNYGDPISLFQFIDQSYCGAEKLDSGEYFDYNSFTLLNLFDVSAVDFIDILTGYGPDIWDGHKMKFDPNGNGLADDWVAPDSYDQSGAGWGINFRNNRLYNSGYDDYFPEGQVKGKIIWSDSPDLLRDGHGDGIIWTPHDYLYNYDDIAGGAPPIVDLFDMLLWLSESTGLFDSYDFIRWILGKLDHDTFYRAINPRETGATNPVSSFNFNGLLNHQIWTMLHNMNLSATGFFEWLEEEKNIDSFVFLHQLNLLTDMVHSLDIIQFATQPNYIYHSDDAISLILHKALNSSAYSSPDDILWAFFDFENFKPGRFFKRLEEILGEKGKTIFDLFISLGIDAASWINILNNEYGILPFELLSVMKRGYVSQTYLELEDGTVTHLDVIANLTISYEVLGEVIELKHFENLQIGHHIELAKDPYFSNFLNMTKLSKERVVFI